jgi:hypothetical protein
MRLLNCPASLPAPAMPGVMRLMNPQTEKRIHEEHAT